MKQPFISIYDRYFNDVYRYVYSKLGNKWDTDDAVSDIFRKAFEHFGSLQADTNSKAWLMTIARNTIFDFYRKKKILLPEESLDTLAQPGSFLDRLELEEDMECLKRALAHLPEEDCEFVKLRYFAEMKYREIGDLVGKSEETVKTRVFRLLKKMSVLVKNCMEGVKSDG